MAESPLHALEQRLLGRGVQIDLERVGHDELHWAQCALKGPGIIDPTKVVRIALENAVSVASVLLLTEATLTEIPGEKKEQANAGLEA